MNNSYKFDYTVKYSEVDSNFQLRLDSIVSHLEDATGFHSHEMGIDAQMLLESSNAFWVLTKMKLKIERLPQQNELIEIETWPTTVSAVRFNRDYAISSDGKRIIMGASEWCTLDYTDRKIRRTNSICYPRDMVHREDRSGAGEFLKIRESVCDTDYNHTYRSSFVDIDANKHTNNITYLRMILNCFSPEEFQSLKIDVLQINFISQTFYGDEIAAYKKKTDNGFYIEGRHGENCVFNCLIILKDATA